MTTKPFWAKKMPKLSINLALRKARNGWGKILILPVWHKGPFVPRRHEDVDEKGDLERIFFFLQVGTVKR